MSEEGSEFDYLAKSAEGEVERMRGTIDNDEIAKYVLEALQGAGAMDFDALAAYVVEKRDSPSEQIDGDVDRVVSFLEVLHESEIISINDDGRSKLTERGIAITKRLFEKG